MFRKVHRTNGLEGFIPSDLLTRSIQISHATDGFEIEDGFAVALVTGRFDFFDGIRQFQKATTPREESGSEIAAQTVADHRHPFLVDHIPELIDVLGMEKLDLIDENTVNPIEIVNFNSIAITDDHMGFTGQSRSGGDVLFTVSIIKTWLDDDDAFSLTFIVVGDGKEIEGLGAADRPMPEIEFCQNASIRDFPDSQGKPGWRVIPCP